MKRRLMRFVPHRHPTSAIILAYFLAPVFVTRRRGASFSDHTRKAAYKRETPPFHPKMRSGPHCFHRRLLVRCHGPYRYPSFPRSLYFKVQTSTSKWFNFCRFLPDSHEKQTFQTDVLCRCSKTWVTIWPRAGHDRVSFPDLILSLLRIF